jgi:hypothetical protein
MHWNNSIATDSDGLKSGAFDGSASTPTLAVKLSLIRLVLVDIRKPAFIFVAMVGLSLPLRLVNLQAPFTGEHEFRQTQTALSVWEIREHGLSLLHPRLPLFGPPWECPFEYPVFQIAAAALDSIAPWNNLDVSIRVTNLLFFYLTALMLALLARLLFTDSVALLASAAFLFSVYNVFWSWTSMIEYAATFFGLAYLLTVILWILRPRWDLFILSLTLGVLGCLTKATSFVIPSIVAGTLACLHVLRLRRTGLWHLNQRKDNSPPSERPNTTFYLLVLAALVIGPIAVGYLYIHFSDGIKEQSPFTAWLSSRHPYTRNWTYGTLAQRLQPQIWTMLWRRMQYVVTPLLSCAMVAGGCALPFRMRQFGGLSWSNFAAGCSLAFAPFIGVLLFYNLYVVHSYYLIACAPFLALFVGVGLSLVFSLVRTRFLRLVLVLLLIGLGLQEWSGRFGTMLSAPLLQDSRVSCLAEAARFIEKDDPVIVVSSTQWSSFAPYYLKRRAFMAMLCNKPVDIQPLLDQDYFKKHGFHWLLIEGTAPGMPELVARIKSQWTIARAVPLQVTHAPYILYSLSDK